MAPGSNAEDMTAYYDAQPFWNDVLGAKFDLTGVGHGGYGHRYNAFLYRRKLLAFQRAISRSGVALAGRSVVDVGCGVGVFSAVAERANVASYTGIDITDVAVARLRETYPAFRYEVADVGSELPAVGPVDVVLCIDVLYHVVDPERFALAVENLWSLVAPGGHLVIVDAMWRRDLVPGGSLKESEQRDQPHVCFHAKADYERLLFARPDATLKLIVPMYSLFNRPIEGVRWPWNRRRLSWHLRYRVFESRPVLGVMFVLDDLLTRVRRNGPDLKIAIVQKAAG